MDPVTFAQSAFPPFAIGFFGLGTGYLIYGPQELFGWPARNQSVDQSVGMWGIFMPGLCQFVAGVILFVGMAWFQVFTGNPAIYMAALAFTAYGVHWFVLGYNRYRQLDARPNAGMCIAYMIISALGAVVFFGAGDWPVGLLFVGLFFIYLSDFFASIGSKAGVRSLGFWHCLTGAWLMYLTFANGVNFSLGWHWPL